MSDAPPEVEFCVTLRARDVRRATLLYLANPRIAAVLVLIVGVGILNAILNHQLKQFYMSTLVFILFCLVFLWIQPILSMRNPVMKAPFCHTFSPLGISTKFRGGDISLEWVNIKKASETSRYVSVYGRNGGAPMLIPKEQLSEREIAQVRTILKSSLHDKAKLM